MKLLDTLLRRKPRAGATAGSAPAPVAGAVPVAPVAPVEPVVPVDTGTMDAAAREPLVAVLPGGRRLRVDPLDSLGLAAGAAFEPAETAVCRALVGPGDRVLDIGANVGYYTVLFAERVGPGGQVIAFEPDPANLALLRDNLAPELASGRVRIEPCALSDAPGRARLYLSDRNAGMHRLYASLLCSPRSADVEVRTGDSLALAPVDFIKIDIEGWEAHALAGLERTLAASPRVRVLSEFSPLSMIEAGSSPLAWLRWMAGLGLRAHEYRDGRWLAAAGDSLLEAAGCLERFDRDSLRAEVLAQADAQDPVLEAGAARVAAAVGYRRPLFENLLFLREGDDGLARLDAAIAD